MALLRHRVLHGPCYRHLGLGGTRSRAFQLVIEALRETPFWDHYFEIVEILVGVENGYAKHYDTDIPATNNA